MKKIKPASKKPNAGIAKAVKGVTGGKRVSRKYPQKGAKVDKHGIQPNIAQITGDDRTGSMTGAPAYKGKTGM